MEGRASRTGPLALPSEASGAGGSLSPVEGYVIYPLGEGAAW